MAFEPRDYQQRIVAQAVKAVEDGHRSILIESPTGSGKTCIGLLIAKELRARHGWRTGWTALRRHLLHQAEAANRQMIGCEDVRYFSLFDKTPPTEIDVLVLDEAHHSASETATTLFETAKPKVEIGLTGTPWRSDRLKLCFSKTIRDAGTRALIDAGWLAPFHQHTFDSPWTPATVADVYLRDKERWGRSVMFFLTLEECHQCADLLRANGTACEVVHGGSDQESQIEAFNQGEIPVLINVVVLTEGFDSPALKTVFVRPGSKGPTIQMAGRALRKHPDKTYAQVVQNSKTDWPFTKIASAEAKFTFEDGVWVLRTATPQRVSQALTNTLCSIPSICVQLPRYLVNRRNRRRRHQRNNETVNAA